ncbi:LysR family transcriptional regulator [Streptomyces sp. NPDC059398]|uniref:LysR family transcriptional regulator n=1 Tax=Streptomyces sp. NPDC059398 TaxID=3346820 RepID=UPI0036B5539D
MIGVELRHLEYFLAVVDERSFTRAAARLHVVQSAVSAGIKALESGLRAELVHRTPRNVQLTEAGRALLPHARETLAAARSAIDAVEEVHGGIRGEVRIGVVASLPDIGLPLALGRLRARYPGVRVRLTQRPGGSYGLADDLCADRLDLALLSEPGPAGRDLRLKPLASFGMRLVIPDGHPLAAEESTTLAELAGETFVDFPAGYGSRSVVDRAFAAAGQHRDVGIEVANADTAAAYARHGLGVAILPEAYLGPGPHPRVVGPGSDRLTWSLSLAVPANRHSSTAARHLATTLEHLARAGTVPDG